LHRCAKNSPLFIGVAGWFRANRSTATNVNSTPWVVLAPARSGIIESGLAEGYVDANVPAWAGIISLHRTGGDITSFTLAYANHHLKNLCFLYTLCDLLLSVYGFGFEWNAHISFL
jgi:hypothetical protein